jgi:Fe-S-cluster-containing hydrogenase component 2/CRP-like cAMP-binding protein
MSTAAPSSTNNQDQFAFDPAMSSVDVEGILNYEPFASIDTNRFPHGKESILEILRHDSRLRTYSSGDLILREGEYANSAFIVLRGSVHVILSQLQIQGNDATNSRKFGLWQRLAASVRGGSRKRPSAVQSSDQLSVRNELSQPQLFLKDIDEIADSLMGHVLKPGSLFGELAAMTRSANEYNVIARDACTLLEVRWQGLRQLRRDRAFRQMLDDRYRETSLRNWLRQHDLFQFCPSEAIEAIANTADLQSYGEREWFVQYNNDKTARTSDQIAAEPIIVNEGENARSLILIRSGFARMSFQYGHSHRTVSYLSKGQLFGLDEIVHNAQQSDRDQYLPFQYSLRALGYLDVVRIDRSIVQQHVLPYCRKASLPEPLIHPRLDRFGSVTPEHLYQPIENAEEESLLEFLVEHRLVNARQAMVINTQRCTRCDDCVRACAAGHNGVSRFDRVGLTFGHLQFTHSCMHCVDPVCMIGCPTGAIHRDPQAGTVAINENTCIGCKTCADACPYQNIVMEVIDQGNGLIDLSQGETHQVASKCDLCSKLPSGPACVAACPHEALERVDLSDTKKMRQWIRRHQ